MNTTLQKSENETKKLDLQNADLTYDEDFLRIFS
jgi:hypothetical protein